MAKTVIGLFDRIDDARQVVQALIDHGFERDDISLVSRQEGEYVTERGDERTSGAAVGAGAASTPRSPSSRCRRCSARSSHAVIFVACAAPRRG